MVDSKKMFMFFVIIPSIFIALYFNVFATNMFVSESSFAVRNREGGTTSTDFSSLLSMKTGGGISSSDSYLVIDYILSYNMIEEIDKELDIKNHYSSKEYDIISRLKNSPTFNDFQNFWERMVTSGYDPDTGIITVSVKAYTPEMAKKINQNILKLSEHRVNEMNSRAREDALEQARKEVEIAKNHVTDIKMEVAKFRNMNTILDPKATATGIQEVVSKLEMDAANVKAELADVTSYMREDSFKVVSLKSRLVALESQINREKHRLAGISENKETLANIAAEYEKLLIKEETAQKQYIAALSSLESARINADSKSKYVEPIRKPLLPDESLYPRKILFSVFAFVALSVFFVLARLIVSIIKEQVEA